ncbi:alpha/beta hydrolase [Furfurilactobacillus entadae]|uniref:alpha/beta hydrolase n=1 Tax=Furfurilactobacillus entadae TaxID=2922307 RepID=UPI0035EDD648
MKQNQNRHGKSSHGHRRAWVVSLIVLVCLVCGGLLAAGTYFFQVAEVRSHKAFINNQPLKHSDPLYGRDQWFKKQHKQRWTITGQPGQLKLVADYLPAATPTKKTVVIAHGFGGNKDKMAAYGTMFHDMGFNVLIPDDRAAGQSQGKYIGYGWLDRRDYVKWLKQVVQKNGADSQLLMFGVSMGGATTMMVSGEPDVPKQVRAYIEDCGYTSVKDEISYQAKSMYGLPAWPLVGIVSEISQIRAGYNYAEASSVNAVKKNDKPMFFIHGDKDTFVPTSMVYKNYRAAGGPKSLWIVKGAKHAASFRHDPTAYQAHIQAFLDQHFK